MDAIDLTALKSELMKDATVAQAALPLAEERLAEDTRSGLDSCAHNLARMYNVIEQAMLRIAKAFENNIDDEKGWHADLLRRMTLQMPGVRPAFVPDELAQPLHDLRAFRHVWNHAYEIQLDPDKLRLLLKYARKVAPRLPALVAQFVRGVGEMHGIDLPHD